MQEERKTVVIPYTPRELQNEIHTNLDRFNVVVCHRRFGKTVFAINQLIKSAVEDVISGKPAPRYAYIAPLFKQAKTVAWDELKRLCGVFPEVKFNEAELRADFMGAISLGQISKPYKKPRLDWAKASPFTADKLNQKMASSKF